MFHVYDLCQRAIVPIYFRGGGTEPKNAISQDGRSKTCGWIALKFCCGGSLGIVDDLITLWDESIKNNFKIKKKIDVVVVGIIFFLVIH